MCTPRANVREELTGKGLESSAASKEGSIYCNSRFKGIIHEVGEGRRGGKHLGQLGALHTQTGSREANAGAQLTFSFSFSSGPQPLRQFHPLLGRIFPPLFTEFKSSPVYNGLSPGRL